MGHLQILLIERTGRLGGWIRSTALPDGTVYEHGPSSLRAGGNSGRNALQLVGTQALCAACSVTLFRCRVSSVANKQ